jgi:trimeric autotransporter adhesin
MRPNLERLLLIPIFLVLVSAPLVHAQVPEDTHWDNRFGFLATPASLAVDTEQVVALGWFPCIGEEASGGRYGGKCLLAHWDGSGWRVTAPAHPSIIYNSLDTAPIALGQAGNDIYVGTTITTVEGYTIPHIAVWQGSEWQPLIGELNGNVRAIRSHPTGLYVGGDFTQAGGETANHVARYAPGWQPLIMDQLANGVNGGVRTIRTSPGRIYLGGDFFNAGNLVGVNKVASWNIGTQVFERLGQGINAASVYDLESAAGAIVAMANNSSHPWSYDGEAWESMATSDFVSIQDLHIADSGTIYGVGWFNAYDSAYGFWNGTTWLPVGPGAAAGGSSSFVAGVGETVYAQVMNLNDGRDFFGFGRWDGASWHPHGQGLGRPYQSNSFPVRALVRDGDAVYAAGSFIFAAGTPASGLARWDGTSWTPLPALAGLDDFRALLVGPEGLVAAGIGSGTYNGIARWDGSSWHGFGSGPAPTGHVLAVATYGGELYAGGSFTTSSGAPASYVSRWDGSGWHQLGSGVSGGNLTPGVNAMAVHDGRLYVAGHFTQAGGAPARHVAAWDGQTWEPVGEIGGPAFSARVTALASYAGSLHALFETLQGPVQRLLYRWNGTTWEQVASFTTPNPLGSHLPWVSALHVNGDDLYVGGDFTHVDGEPAWRIAKWDGASWSSLGSGIWASAVQVTGTAEVIALTGSPEGLWVGGYFNFAGSGPSTNIALWRDYVHAPVSAEPPAGPSWFSLSAPYPNPASASATITLTLDRPDDVRVLLYDVLGRRVSVVYDGPLVPGAPHDFIVSVSELPSGLYIVRAEGASGGSARRLTVAR